MLKETYSFNLIAYLRSNGVTVDVHKKDNKIYGVYENSDHNKQVKEQYRNDEELHRFLNEFKTLKLSRFEQVNE